MGYFCRSMAFPAPLKNRDIWDSDLLMVSQKVEKTVIASEAKQSPPWQGAGYRGLLRRFPPRNDSLGIFLRGYYLLFIFDNED